jgi:DNA-binding response OmpR family regulator
MLTEYLTDSGHTVEVATNGREGLEKFHQGTFDLMMTDRALPEMNGDQLAIAVKRIAPKMPVIMLTGFGDLMEASGEKPAGVDMILSG